MEFRLIQTEPELASLEKVWNALLEKSASHVPFLRFEYQKIWWRNQGGGEWKDAQLAIAAGYQDGELAGIAPLFHTQNHDGDPALMLIGSIEISDYLDVITRPEDTEAFIAGLLPFLAEASLPRWTVLDWYNVLDSSATLPALERAAARAGWEFRTEPYEHTPIISLPGDWETYLNQIEKKQRHEIRRKMRRAEENIVPVRWYATSQSDRLDEDVDAFFSLMRQDAAKEQFLTPPMANQMREMIRCAFDAGCLQMAFLEVGGEKAAGYLNFDYLNRIWVYNSGFDNRFRELSPGWVLLGYLLKWANDNRRESFDFMRGSEEYKYRFGARDRMVLRALVRRPETAQ